jgi:hypothetical protein
MADEIKLHGLKAGATDSFVKRRVIPAGSAGRGSSDMRDLHRFNASMPKNVCGERWKDAYCASVDFVTSFQNWR